jgi:predicted HTH domain antitoxin
MGKTKAIYMYENKKVNLNTAAWIAHLSVRDFMSELESRGIALNLTPEMVTYSLDVLAKVFNNEKLQIVLKSEE